MPPHRPRLCSARLRAAQRPGHETNRLYPPARSVVSKHHGKSSKIQSKAASRRRRPHQGAGQGRAHAARTRTRRARQALLSRRRAHRDRRRVRRVAPALQRDRKALSGFRQRGVAVAESRRGAVGSLQEGPAFRSDAVARQRLCRRGRPRLRRPHRALPEARRRQGRFLGRAEDRRPLDVAALRGRRARHRGDPRRRRRRRGRHRQHPHARRRAAEAERPQRPRHLRGARRGLHDQEGLPRAQRAAEGGRRHHLRQSAQLGRGLAPAEGPDHHRLAPPRLLRLCLGRDERDAGGYAERHDRLVRALRLQDQSADQALSLRRGAARVPSVDRGAARKARLRHRRRRLQGRPHRLAGTARLRLAHAALGASRTNSRPSAP